MFRLTASQLIDSGACRQVDIIKAFGVPKSSVDRSLQTLREKGPEAFFAPRKKRSGGRWNGEHLNAAEVEYPGTEMRLYYELGGIVLNDKNRGKGVT